ncbi:MULTISPECIES: hypothetical protein [Providencia]|uniref:hypothetical protein n=1 Tax=Providencia TaxID=586 RepID=UPI0008388A87|nr:MULTISPECIES: hypothetical protein [Providencia]MBP6121501.1 hypothetical protein [Providencia sp.]NIH22689.1 hypothetical protein [Providencia heimbachae]
MRAEFEEKTFENAFNAEFSYCYGLGRVYSFGQVQEGRIGLDSALYLEKNYWLHLKFLSSPFLKGEHLPFIAERMEEFLNHRFSETFEMTVNLLLQYKRPELLTTETAGEWEHWKKPYFRYVIDENQQTLLERLSNQFGSQALVLYASPAFIKMKELQTALKNKELINKTNFCPASKLTNHHSNTYIENGSYSIACSEPEELEYFDLIQTLTQTSQAEFDANSIIEFANTVSHIISENEIYGHYYLYRIEQYSDFERYPLLFSHIRMRIFSDITGIQWGIVIQGK